MTRILWRYGAVCREHERLRFVAAECRAAVERTQLQILRRPPARNDRQRVEVIEAAPPVAVALDRTSECDTERLTRNRQLRVNLQAPAIPGSVGQDRADDP